MDVLIWGITGVALVASFLRDKQKTIGALKMAAKRLWKITPLFFYVIALTSIVMTLVPTYMVQRILGKESGIGGILLALGLGSVTMMPGFVAFPLSAMLKTQGITYTVLAAFTMTLMNVGVVTYPLERRYLGSRVALIRNGIALLVSMMVALMIAIVFGEVVF